VDDSGSRGLTVDAETFEARFGDIPPCFLGNTIEFHLLARLNHRPGRYVSINTLRDDVWHEDDTAKNTIQRTISNLRRKLGDAGISEVVIDGSQKDHYRLVLPQ
jgi:DNA-binding response OmpR family regulator